ncbi:MAG: PAS domain S-box protein [Pseudomonadota bacterium]
MSEAASTSGDFFKRLVENAQDIITVIKRNGDVVYQSPALERILGYKPAESIGTNVFDAIHADDQQQAHTTLVKILSATQSPIETEVRFRHADSNYRHLHVVANLLDDEPEQMIVVTARDVTQQIKSNELLAAGNELLSKVFSLSQNILTITLPDTGEYLEVNEAWCKSLGYSREEAIGKTASELGIWGSDKNRDRIIGELNRTGRLQRLQATVYNKDGEPRTILVDGQFLSIADEPRILLSCVDITESLLVEEELRHSQKMESLGQLTGGVAHDFNNLLGVAMGNAELLLLTLENHPTARKYAQQILDATIRGADLTQQLLAFARRQTLAPEPLNIAQLLENMQTMLQTTLSENTRIEMNFDENLAQCMVDPNQLENTILNLTLNARDAMPHGGVVRYEVRNMSVTEHTSPFPGLALPTNNYILLQVCDNGHGMDELTRLRAMEPFFTTKAVGKGTGLGLSMVFGFAEQSGGNVHIDSILNQGTTVSLIFPLPRPNSVSTEVQTKVSDDPAQMTVLVVEDNEPLRQLVAMFLSEEGFNILESRGEEDLNSTLQKAQNVDILVSDIVLEGGLNGPEVAQRVAHRFPTIKTLLITGFAGTEPVHGHPVLHKPFTRDQFLDALYKLVARPKGNQG